MQDQTVAGTTWTPSAPLLSGHNYRWWVRALNTGGSAGIWSNSVDFAVAMPTLIGPTGTVNTVLPPFTWTGLDGAAQYEIYVSDLTAGTAQDQTVTGATPWTPATPLVSSHSYRWWIRALGSGGLAGVWSTSLTFAVALPALTAPSGTVGTVVPPFIWNGLGGVTQYEIYLSDLTASKVQDQTVTGTTWTPAAPLVSGHSYRWWVRALGSGGTAGGWSKPLDFAVALPTLIGPKNTVSTLLPSFTWNEVGAAKYEIYVSDLTAGSVQDQNGKRHQRFQAPTTPLVSGPQLPLVGPRPG